MGNNTSTSTSPNTDQQITVSAKTLKQISSEISAKQQKIKDEYLNKKLEEIDKKYNKKVEAITKKLYNIDIKQKLLEAAKKGDTFYSLNKNLLNCDNGDDRNIFNELFKDYKNYVNNVLNIDVDMRLDETYYPYATNNTHKTEYIFTWR